MAEESESRPLPLRIFRSDASLEYGKRIAALEDIRFAIDCLARLYERNKDKNSDRTTREALWDASVVRLFASFRPGKYALDPEDILGGLPDGALEGFEFFYGYRNKHVAHKANPVDRLEVGVILGDPSSKKAGQVLGVGHLGSADAYFSDQRWVGSLGKLARALLLEVEKQVAVWQERVLGEAKAKVDDLYKAPPIRIVPPGHNRYLFGSRRS